MSGPFTTSFGSWFGAAYAYAGSRVNTEATQAAAPMVWRMGFTRVLLRGIGGSWAKSRWLSALAGGPDVEADPGEPAPQPGRDVMSGRKHTSGAECTVRGEPVDSGAPDAERSCCRPGAAVAEAVVD